MRTFIMTLGSLAVLTLCTFSAVPSAQADGVPAQCGSARDTRFYNLGVRKGRNLAQQAINSLGDDEEQICQDPDALADLEDLIREIVDAIEIPAHASQATRCHVFGQIAGLIAEIVDFQEECPIICCIADGRLIGEISAKLYCELSIALGGLVPVELFDRLATDTCGERFQESCDEKFAYVATSDHECKPFTKDEFEEVFEEAQNNQCAANPGDGHDPHPDPHMTDPSNS